ncbi:cupredoxin domain-containing protein [Vineibacter terrae]|uniref:Cupredoxin domain-containing protein n=1 Tax=Vineibacter terrae TaxID=2586908 RepID=A0A5C8PI41_9HYPH|nr:cupredoxin domain-containing protein [Vineibacter terrae]
MPRIGQIGGSTSAIESRLLAIGHRMMSVLKRLRLIMGLLLLAVGFGALVNDVIPAARADDTPFEVRITIRDHKFEPAMIEVPPNRALKLIVTNADSTAEEFESVGLKIERVIPPGKTAEFVVKPLRANRNYKFFGEFHPDTAQGQVVVKNDVVAK